MPLIGEFSEVNSLGLSHYLDRSFSAAKGFFYKDLKYIINYNIICFRQTGHKIDRKFSLIVLILKIKIALLMQ